MPIWYHDEIEEYQALCDLNLLGIWCSTGHEWTSIVKNDSLELTNQPLAQTKSNSTRSIVLLGTLVALALVGAATLTQSSVASGISQENVKVLSSQ